MRKLCKGKFRPEEFKFSRERSRGNQTHPFIFQTRKLKSRGVESVLGSFPALDRNLIAFQGKGRGL